MGIDIKHNCFLWRCILKHKLNKLYLIHSRHKIDSFECYIEYKHQYHFEECKVSIHFDTIHMNWWHYNLNSLPYWVIECYKQNKHYHLVKDKVEFHLLHYMFDRNWQQSMFGNWLQNKINKFQLMEPK